MSVRDDGFVWILFNIYGPAHVEKKKDFLHKIQQKILDTDLPVVLGGDFNLIRRVEEKSSGNVDFGLMDAFNDMINDTALKELHRSGSRYTWSNKQSPPIMCVLDRVLVSNSWEDRFNLASVLTAPRLGSDHNPLIVDTNNEIRVINRGYYFRYSAHWAKQDGFCDWVQSKWPYRVKVNPLDHWHIVSSKLRRAIKGWGQNVDSYQKRYKMEIMKRITELDEISENRELAQLEWEERYMLEKEILKVLSDEEIQWQRKGGEKWLLDGDRNTGYFHKRATGRKKKMHISALEQGDQMLNTPKQLKKHITDYYKSLFGKVEMADIHLEADMWPAEQRSSHVENEGLVRKFSFEELDFAIKEMKNNTAPGLDGFSVEFFKTFWSLIRGNIKEMLDQLHSGHLELWRLNYGVIILLPKVKPAIHIKQFRPICLLNVIYKIITKVLTVRLTKVMDKLISPFQIAFIPGRNILEGVVIVQEVLHELKVLKTAGVILKLDFEKAYDKVS